MKKGMYIIDLHKTKVKLEEALTALKKIAKTGRKYYLLQLRNNLNLLLKEK